MNIFGYCGAFLLFFYCYGCGYAQKDIPSEFNFFIFDENRKPLNMKLLPYQFYTDTFDGDTAQKIEMDSLYKNHKKYPKSILKAARALKQDLMFGVLRKSAFLRGYHLLTDENYRFLIVSFYGYNKYPKNQSIKYHWSRTFDITLNTDYCRALFGQSKEKKLLPIPLQVDFYGYAPNFMGLIVFPLDGREIKYKGIVFGASKKIMMLKYSRAVVEIYLDTSLKSKIKQVDMKKIHHSAFMRKLFFKL